MFDKDQYDQEEYNNYYEQETRGAEILGGRRKKNGSKKILIGSLFLGLIAVGGYFGFDKFRNIIDKNITNNLKNIILDKKSEPQGSNETVSTDSKSSNKESKIKDEVEEAVNSNNIDSKISPEDIANIVQLVMMKMKEEQQAQNKSTKSEDNNSDNSVKVDLKKSATKENNATSSDSELFKSLSQSEVDTLEEENRAEKAPKLSKKETTKEATHKEDIKDTYNKVVLKDGSNKGSDELSRLSNDISNIVESEDKSKSDKSEYAKKLKEEAKQRKKEMRYIIVKKGDTLGKIAKRVYGNVMAYKKIYEANPDILKRPDRIYIGQKLRVPE